jgi:hypothetical protein
MTAFSVRPGDDIKQFYLGLVQDGAGFVGPMLDPTRSVRTEGASDLLAAHTSRDCCADR